MTYVITEACIGSKDTACVDVCPVDAIHPSMEEDGYDDAKQLFIDPNTCIDCDACRNACPTSAIFAKASVPPELTDAIERNARHYRLCVV